MEEKENQDNPSTGQPSSNSTTENSPAQSFCASAGELPNMLIDQNDWGYLQLVHALDLEKIEEANAVTFEMADPEQSGMLHLVAKQLQIKLHLVRPSHKSRSSSMMRSLQGSLSRLARFPVRRMQSQ